MKTNDIFLRITLLVIALNLTFLSLDKINLIPQAYTNESVNTDELLPVKASIPTNEDGSINVKIISSEIPLDIKGKLNLSETLNVNLTQINGQKVPQTVYYFRDGTEAYPMMLAPTHY